MDPDEFAAEMELEKGKLRKEACRNYIVGAIASFCLYALFWVVVTAQNAEAWVSKFSELTNKIKE